MNKYANYATGVKYGLIAGLVYCLMLFFRYAFFGSNPIQFGAAAFVSFLIFVVILVLAGRARRKELGGYADIKQLFQTLFVAIIIAEIFYALFTFVYLEFIDKNFWDTYIQGTREWMMKMGTPEDKVEEAISKANGQKDITFGKSILGFGMWIVLDGIVAFIIGFSLKKAKPIFEDVQK